MKSPQHCSHKPIISVNDYDQIDAMYVSDGTDARALSIGKATWNKDLAWNKAQISLKIWRHTGERWSPQSEEMPIHRCLDLAILFLASLKKDKDLPYPNPLQLTVNDESHFHLIRDFYESVANRKHIDTRLRTLRDLLNEWYEREGGKYGK